MCNLTNAYTRVIKDISLNEKNRILKECNDLSKIHDEELADIDKFSKEMPSFMDIYLETHDDINLKLETALEVIDKFLKKEILHQ